MAEVPRGIVPRVKSDGRVMHLCYGARTPPSFEGSNPRGQGTVVRPLFSSFQPLRFEMNYERPAATIEALRAIRHKILASAHRRKASNIRVFGSVARGSADRGSDVDLLVSMNPSATLVDLIGLEQDLEALLGRSVDIITDDVIPPEMEAEVRATAIPL